MSTKAGESSTQRDTAASVNRRRRPSADSTSIGTTALVLDRRREPLRSDSEPVQSPPSLPAGLLLLAASAGFATLGPGAPTFRMIDWPATYHNMAAGFAFADGHSEIRKWVWAETDLELRKPTFIKGGVRSPDIVWMQERTSALINK